MCVEVIEPWIAEVEKVTEGRVKIDMGSIVRGVLPFIASDLIRVMLVATLPVLTLWLPNLLFKSSGG